jgi:uncharacterized protein (DUF2236 family)
MPIRTILRAFRQSDWTPFGDDPSPDQRLAWTINAERLVVLGWGQAVLMQLAHPLVAAGVAQHSTFKASPIDRVRRFRHTLDAMLTFTYGSQEDALRVAAHINGIHDRVNGASADTIGSTRAGDRYSAHDPELLRWVHATLIDSSLRTYERYVGHLPAAMQDRYCSEATSIGPLLGIPDELLPRSRSDLDKYLQTTLDSGVIAVGPTARRLAGDLLGLSPGVMGMLELPLIGSYRLATAGLLPSEIRASYGLRWTAAHQAIFEASSRASRIIRPVMPPVITQWRVARTAQRRAA